MSKQEQAGMASLDLDALERKALAADVERWEQEFKRPYVIKPANPSFDWICHVQTSNVENWPDRAAFIAAANPAVVFKLIRRLRAAESAAPAQGQEATAGFDLVTHLHRQRDFSERTFGPGARTAGVIDHIRKELVEVEMAPDDVTEWVDVVLLALDGAWRSGHTPEQIAAAIAAKQAKNEARNWPDWRTADPDKAICHILEGGAAPAQGQEAEVSAAARDVLAERARQVSQEGWTPEHDDQHEIGELADAAACYAGNAGGYVWEGGWPGEVWPWKECWWKPTTPRRDLVKAGALILAEIERLDRAERRTALGRQKVAEAHAKALQAKVDLREEELRFMKGGAV